MTLRTLEPYNKLSCHQKQQSVNAFEFTCELVRLLGMGVVEEHTSKKAYYWRIFSRINMEAFYKFVYQQPQLGLQRKKQKIEKILGSYRRG